MAQDTDQLRADLDQQRAAISSTVDEIENRVSPSRIVARRQDRVRRTVRGWKDTVFGTDDDPTERGPFRQALGVDGGAGDGGALQSAKDGVSTAVETISAAPDAVRRQAQGNPIAAGAVALGVGWLIGSLLPDTDKERELVHKAEPQLTELASTVRSEGQQMAEEIREPAREAVEQVKEAGREAAAEVKDSGQEAASAVKDRATT